MGCGVWVLCAHLAQALIPVFRVGFASKPLRPKRVISLVVLRLLLGPALNPKP